MVTNNYDFKTVTRLRMLCMKVLPTVYGDALSYEEQVCKVTEKINQLVDTVNALPDYIVEVVKELIDAAGLEDIVKQVLADLYFVNVKNPPAPLVAAKGDGTTNDTVALQALINYAATNHTYLYFPKGSYLVNGLTMSNYVSLVGMDRYSTILTLAPNSNVDLVKGFIENCTITGMMFNANMNAQTSNCSCINATVENALIEDVIFKNGYNSVVIDNTGMFQGNEWLFDGVQHDGLTINGDGANLTSIQFMNISKINANTLININGENTITNVESNEAIPLGVVLTGTNSYVRGVIKNATNTVRGGEGNNVAIFTGTSTLKYDNTVNENYSGSVTTTARNKTINATDIKLNPTNPLGYKQPSAINNYFSSVPFKDPLNNAYNVLVAGPDIGKLGSGGGGQAANVRDYGAIGDGVADDSQAFINAVTASSLVYVPDGNYRVMNVNINKNIVIFGSGNIIPIAKSNGQSMNTCFTFNGFNAVVDGLTFSPNPSSTPTGTKYVTVPTLMFVNCEFGRVTNCKAGGYNEDYRAEETGPFNTWNGLFLTAHDCKYFMLDHNVFGDFTNQEFMWFHATDFKSGNYLVTGNRWTNHSGIKGSALNVLGGTLFFVENRVDNYTNVHGGVGYSVYNLLCDYGVICNNNIEASAESVFDTTEGYRVKNTYLVISNNNIKLTGDFCVSTCAQDCIISNNVFSGAAPIHSLVFSTATNNIYYNNAKDRFTFNSITVEGNTININGKGSTVQRGGISLFQEADTGSKTKCVKIANNTIYGSQANGYAPIQLMSDYEYCEINGNMIKCTGIESWTAIPMCVALRTTYAFTGMLVVNGNTFGAFNNPTVNYRAVSGAGVHATDKIAIICNYGGDQLAGAGRAYAIAATFTAAVKNYNEGFAG